MLLLLKIWWILNNSYYWTVIIPCFPLSFFINIFSLHTLLSVTELWLCKVSLQDWFGLVPTTFLVKLQHKSPNVCLKSQSISNIFCVEGNGFLWLVNWNVFALWGKELVDIYHQKSLWSWCVVRECVWRYAYISIYNYISNWTNYFGWVCNFLSFCIGV